MGQGPHVKTNKDVPIVWRCGSRFCTERQSGTETECPLPHPEVWADVFNTERGEEEGEEEEEDDNQ